LRLKEINIQRYGPIRPFHHHLKEGVNVIYGPNGSGKTLIIDALLKMFIGTGPSDFEKLERVDEYPEGYPVFEEDGEEIKLERSQLLSDILEIGPDELRNIFVVRDSDVSIKEETRFYENTIDRLVGVRTEDIRRIKEQLTREGRLTETQRWISDKEEYHNAKTELQEGEKLKEEVEEYIEKAESEGLENLEAEVFSARLRKNELSKRIQLLEKAKNKEEFTRLEKDLHDAESLLGELEGLPDEEEFSPLNRELSSLDRTEENRPQLERSVKFWSRLSYFSIIASALVFVCLVAFGLITAIALAIPSVFLIILMISVFLSRSASGKLSELERIQISVVQKANELGLMTKTVEEVRAKISGIKAERRHKKTEFDKKAGVLEGTLKIEVIDSKDSIPEAQENLEEMRKNIDFNVDISYSEEEVENTKKELREEVEKRISELEEKLTGHNEQIKNFSKRAHSLSFFEFLRTKLDLEIENLESLHELVNHLDKFISQIGEDAELSRKALKIFDEMETEEEAKTAELFGKGNRASEILKKITGGMFERVRYNPKEEEIVVHRSTGKKQVASDLSRAEYSQLYLAIRVALGEECLKGKKGFFIMEDPLLHSDPERLQEQFDLLIRLSEMGWQTLYFTAKNEVRNRLPKLADANLIELERLP